MNAFHSRFRRYCPLAEPFRQSCPSPERSQFSHASTSGCFFNFASRFTFCVLSEERFLGRIQPTFHVFASSPSRHSKCSLLRLQPLAGVDIQLSIVHSHCIGRLGARLPFLDTSASRLVSSVRLPALEGFSNVVHANFHRNLLPHIDPFANLHRSPLRNLTWRRSLAASQFC